MQRIIDILNNMQTQMALIASISFFHLTWLLRVRHREPLYSTIRGILLVLLGILTQQSAINYASFMDITLQNNMSIFPFLYIFIVAKSLINAGILFVVYGFTAEHYGHKIWLGLLLSTIIVGWYIQSLS